MNARAICLALGVDLATVKLGDVAPETEIPLSFAPTWQDGCEIIEASISREMIDVTSNGLGTVEYVSGLRHVRFRLVYPTPPPYFGVFTLDVIVDGIRIIAPCVTTSMCSSPDGGWEIIALSTGEVQIINVRAPAAPALPDRLRGMRVKVESDAP